MVREPARALWAATATVAALGLIVEVAHHTASPPEELVALLSLSFEANLPTWYASGLLLGCALALAGIAAAAERSALPHVFRWRLLAAVFLYMSLDEVAMLHERLNDLLPLHGALRFSWILPAAAVVAALGVAYLPFLKALPARSRNRFLLAGALYVGGALVMELPLGWWAERFGEDGLGYALIDFVEEALELAGATWFLCSLLDHRTTIAGCGSPPS
jgi:hypothetical protein